MIHSDTTIRCITIKTPNASASTLLKVLETGGDVAEEDQVTPI
jgi:hypothetical protein